MEFEMLKVKCVNYWLEVNNLEIKWNGKKEFIRSQTWKVIRN